jgi:predicted RNase H-like HicB family nuclease
MDYTIRLHRGADDTWWAEVDELSGCFGTGQDLTEALASLAESISIYLKLTHD